MCCSFLYSPLHKYISAWNTAVWYQKLKLCPLLKLHLHTAVPMPLLEMDPSVTSNGGRDSAVGIATRYGLDGPGIESRWGRDFPQPSRPALGPTQPPVQWVPGLHQG